MLMVMFCVLWLLGNKHELVALESFILLGYHHFGFQMVPLAFTVRLGCDFSFASCPQHMGVLPLFCQRWGSSNSIPRMARTRPMNEEWESNWPMLADDGFDCQQWFLMVGSHGQ